MTSTLAYRSETPRPPRKAAPPPAFRSETPPEVEPDPHDHRPMPMPEAHKPRASAPWATVHRTPGKRNRARRVATPALFAWAANLEVTP